MEPVKTSPVRIEAWEDLAELIRMSVGTDRGSWWADPDFGSELRILKQEGKITGKTAGTLQRMILECLDWLKADGLAKNIGCYAERAGKNEIRYEITVERPRGAPVLVKDVWYAL
ncbi:MAG: phage GP46 family protein [Treponema sp.]|jgi:phage gp46-like protein|nr:phage GP46 family protein [Treponema sp.]